MAHGHNLELAILERQLCVWRVALLVQDLLGEIYILVELSLVVEEILVVGIQEVEIILPLQQHVRTASECLALLVIHRVVVAVVLHISALGVSARHAHQLINSPIKGYMEAVVVGLVLQIMDLVSRVSQSAPHPD